jgi:nucleoside diphosphate kinase
MNHDEYTLSIIKPDATSRNLTSEINECFTNDGLRVVEQKTVTLTRAQAEEFYAEHIDIKLLKTCGEGDSKQKLISRWLYDLHENVNQRKSVESGITFESLEELYKDINFSEVRTQFSDILVRALQQNIVLREHVLQWKTIIAQLYGIYR